MLKHFEITISFGDKKKLISKINFQIIFFLYDYIINVFFKSEMGNVTKFIYSLEIENL